MSSDNYLKGKCNSISVAEALSSAIPIIDVRTAEEFQAACIPDAHNIALFDALERSEIGTLYKQVGASEAIKHGTQLIQPRVAEFIQHFCPFQSQTFAVSCARGGMRSGSVVRLLNAHGFQALQLTGGYKAYRKYVLEALNAESPELIVLHGQTGVGKTLMLEHLPNAIDLEGLAQHRSSLFGAVNKNPRTQKNFDALLHQRLMEVASDAPLFIEGESRKIGQVFMPDRLAKAMKQGTLVLLTASTETRVSRLVEEYYDVSEKTIQQLDAVLQSMKQALGGKVMEHLRFCLKSGKLEEGLSILLSEYYDVRYQHAMRNYDYALTVSVENLEEAAKQLIEFKNGLDEA